MGLRDIERASRPVLFREALDQLLNDYSDLGAAGTAEVLYEVWKRRSGPPGARTIRGSSHDFADTGEPHYTAAERAAGISNAGVPIPAQER